MSTNLCFRLLILTLSCACVGNTSANGQDRSATEPLTGGTAQSDSSGGVLWFLADHLYYEPLLAEPHAARTFLLIPAKADKFPHSEVEGSRLAWQATLGREIPILGWQNDRATGLGPFSKGKWGFGLWIPISFHMIEDFEDTSNPIVDTDYRFGFMVKAQYGISGRSTLSFRFIPWAHESTHLGDEYVLVAAKQPSFERINVSYEYYQYGISYEQQFGTRGLLTLRHGGTQLYGEDGYYSDHLLGSDEATLTPSTANYEPSVGIEVRLPKASRGRQWIASIDFRKRLEYEFHRAPGVDDVLRPSWTLAVGRASPLGDRTLLRSYFLYYSSGVNPYGQLREQYPFRSFGMGWIFQ